MIVYVAAVYVLLASLALICWGLVMAAQRQRARIARRVEQCRPKHDYDAIEEAERILKEVG